MLLLNEQEILEKSLAVQNQMTFKQFVLFNNIGLDAIMVDKMFHNIRNDIPIYMDETMIEYFGYSGKLKEQRMCLNRLIENNFTEYQNKLWHSYKNKEYIEFCENNQKSLERQSSSSKINGINGINSDISTVYPPAPTGRGTATTKHLLIMPKLFKEMLMLCQTDKGKQVRRYYIDMMEVMELYIKFQNQVHVKSLNSNITELTANISEMKTIMLESEKKRDEDSKKRDDEYKQSEKKRDEDSKKRDDEYKQSEKKRDEEEKRQEDRYKKLFGTTEEINETLKVVSKNHVDINKLDLKKHPKFIILKDPDDDQMPYYVIRRQQESLQDAIDDIKIEYPKLKVWLNIPQPNAIAFFNLIKKELGEYMIRDGNWFGLKDIRSGEFKRKVKALNKSRKTPPKQKCNPESLL
jgi:hypothetical protein